MPSISANADLGEDDRAGGRQFDEEGNYGQEREQRNEQGSGDCDVYETFQLI